jgi:hypothetical protein
MNIPYRECGPDARVGPLAYLLAPHARPRRTAHIGYTTTENTAHNRHCVRSYDSDEDGGSIVGSRSANRFANARGATGGHRTTMVEPQIGQFPLFRLTEGHERTPAATIDSDLLTRRLWVRFPRDPLRTPTPT